MKIVTKTRKPASPGVKTLSPDAVRVDPEIQQRAGGLDQLWVQELAEVLNAGGVFRDKPIVYSDGEQYHLAGGFHRHAAATETGARIEYEVRPGTRRDAWIYSLGDNSGKPRSSHDIRKAITSILDDPEFQKQFVEGKLSNREIARLVCCADSTVNSIVRERTGKKVDPEKSSAARMGNAAKAEKKAAEKAKAAEKPPEPKREASPEPKAEKQAEIVDDGAGGPHLDQLGREIPGCLDEVWKASPGYCVCPACDGDGDSELCPTCTGSGIIAGEIEFFRMAPEMRQKAASYGVPCPTLDPDRDGDDYTKRVERVCLALKAIHKDIVELGRSPFARWTRIDSVGATVESARKTLWNGRPIERCNCEGKKHDCSVCGGCGRVSKVGLKASEVPT